MAQTTGGISFKANKIEQSTDGSNWTDISGFSNTVEVDGGERAVEEFFTFDGDTPIISSGKRSMLEVKVKIVYTEGASDPQEVYRAAYEAGTAMYYRWSPKGGSGGQFRYTTSAGVPITPPYPGGDAGSAETVAIEQSINCASITKAAI